MADNKQAKVDVILNVNNALANIDKLQKRLDNISLKRLNTSNTNQLFNGLNQNTDKAIRKVESLRTAYVRAVSEMRTAMDKNRTSFTFQQTDEFKGLLTNVNTTKRQLGHIINLFDKLHQNQKDVINQSTLTRISELNTRLKLTIKNTERLIDRFEKLKSLDTDGLFTNLSNSVNKVDIARINDEAKKLQATLESVSNTANSIDNNIGKKRVGRKSGSKSKELTTYYHPEQNTLEDYFMVRFRSGIAKSVGTYIENYLSSNITSIFDSIKQFEQNRVNFAQVMPNDIADNQELMNNAMSNFTKIASEYGTTVQDVVEAGRLWGRQYKDIAIVESLVRNTTKLSITDNMSLVEVNKALEATMQQYNVKLKDYNEAQQVGNHVIDTWAKLADNAVVTASDLAKANEQSAGAAYQAGIGFDYLQALITTMSTATGKAGAEVGRSIRSMLVSMNSDKAKKYFNELGIATTELVNGEVRVRSFEKVITELMDKLQKSPKDVSKVILAMSGGKYQYNNVMALLKGQKEFIKNLETVRNSAGWADEQVGLQQETITRQIAGLKADLEQFVVTMEKIGANKSIANLIKDIRGLISVLNEISPEGFQRMVDSIKWFLFLQGLDLVQVGLIKTVDKFNIAKDAIKSFSISSIRDIKNWKNISTAFSIVTGYVGAFLIALQAGLAIYEAWEEHNKKLADSLDVSKVTNSFSDLSSKTNDIRELSKAIQDNQAIVDDSTKSDNEKLKAEKALSDSKKRLLELLPEEAQARVRASGYAKEAIERELNMLYKLQEQKMLESENAIKAEISKTQVTISQTENRITAYTKEIEALTERNKMLAESSKIAKQFGFDGITDEYGNNYEEQNQENIEYFKNLKTEAEQLKKDSEQKIKDLQQQLKDLKESYKVNTVDIKGTTGGITEDNDGNNNRGTSTNTTNEDKQRAIRLAYQTKHNELWYKGNIEAKAYANSLKEVTNLEQLYGTTITSINAKDNIYKKYKDDLIAYQSELESYKQVIMSDLDNRIAGNKELANVLEYNNNLTFEEKLKVLEVNSARLEEYKTISYIYNELNKVVQKQEEIKGKQSDINLEIERANQLRYKQKLEDIENETQMQLSMLNRPNNYRYESQKLDIELAEARRLLEEHNNEIIRLEGELNEAIELSDLVTIESTKKLLEQRRYTYEQENAKIAELEYQKNYSIRSGWADITQQFIIQGNSLKEIWSNLWKDLAREAIQRLFQVQVRASFLGSSLGLFGSKSTPIAPPQFEATNKYLEGWKPWNSHTGSNVGVYPKMHTGGMVEKGRRGVTPKLGNDEVIRTLQVGEEVNSIKERRSNEILASVAMKAIDSKYQQPTNVNITALDSRSFAEYLNDNADILMAVLNKQGALGR